RSTVGFTVSDNRICQTLSVPRCPINTQIHFIYQAWPLPPSIFTAVPLTYDAKSEQRKVITFAASDVSPIRPSGMLSALEAENSSHDNSGDCFCQRFSIWSLRIRPMHTAFTRTPYCPRSLLIALVSASPALRDTVVGREFGWGVFPMTAVKFRSEEHTSELQSRFDLVCRLL